MKRKIRIRRHPRRTKNGKTMVRQHQREIQRGRERRMLKTYRNRMPRYGMFKKPVICMTTSAAEAAEYGNIILAFDRPKDARGAGQNELRSELPIDSWEIFVYDLEKDKYYSLQSIVDGYPEEIEEDDLEGKDLVYHGTNYENLENIYNNNLQPQWNIGEYKEIEIGAL